MDRARHHLLARARLAEDQHGHVEPRHAIDALHHRPQPALAPMIVSPSSVRPSRESSESRSASAASRSVVISRRRRSFSSATVKGSSSARSSASCSAVEAPRRLRHQHDHARAAPRRPRADRPARRPRVRARARPAGARAGSRRRRARPRRAGTRRAGAGARGAESSLRAELAGGAGPTLNGGDGLHAGAREIDAPDRDRVERQAAQQDRRGALERLLDLDVPAGLAPELEQQRHEALHRIASYPVRFTR